jgi:hypothetical protein
VVSINESRSCSAIAARKRCCFSTKNVSHSFCPTRSRCETHIPCWAHTSSAGGCERAPRFGGWPVICWRGRIAPRHRNRWCQQCGGCQRKLGSLNHVIYRTLDDLQTSWGTWEWCFSLNSLRLLRRLHHTTRGHKHCEPICESLAPCCCRRLLRPTCKTKVP